MTLPPQYPPLPPPAAAPGSPSVADAPPRERPANPSRDVGVVARGAVEDGTLVRSSSGSEPPKLGERTTSGRNNNVFASPSSLSPSAECGRRQGPGVLVGTTPPPDPTQDPTQGVGLFWRAGPGQFSRAPKRNSKRTGFGWKRWSRRWLYTNLGLFAAYRVDRRSPQKALPV